MTKPRVLISDSMSSLAISVFEERGVEAVVSSKLSPEELKDTIGDFDGLAMRSSTKVTSDVLESAKRLRVVGRAGIGVDNIDVPACTARGIVVMNTPFGNAITTAEHAMAMMLSLARHIPQASASTHAGKWEKSKFMGMELTGKLLGLIGAGNIGSIVAQKAIGYGLRVQAYDPFLTEERAAKLGVVKVELETLLKSSDIISLHVPKTPETENIIDATAINRMKKGSENPLFGTPNLICTPHLGAATAEAQEKVAVQVAEQMSEYLLNDAITNALNAPNLSSEEARQLKPYLQLAQRLGSFVGQLTHDPIKSLTVTYAGDLISLNTDPLTTQVTQSLLEQHQSSVNAVNAREVARNRNIDVIDAHSDGADEYQCRMTVAVKTESMERHIAGTLIGNRPRVIDVKGIPLESELGEHMLYITNKDTPGVVGAIGTTAGGSGINIANLHLGRGKEGSDAIALLEVDDKVSSDHISAMQAIKGITDVKYLHFPSLN